MKRLSLILAAGLAVLVLPTRLLAADPLQLQKSVRTLENLQDRAAAGDAEAARLQVRLITQIETDISLTPDENLKLPQNLEALVTILLSGGNPNVIEAHTTNLNIDENMRNLITGALAYARADREGAVTWLNKVEIAHLPPTLGGRVALVRSIIGAGENASKAIDDLYLARQLMPGTLVEEASLRRCVAFAGKLADLERLKFCAGRYMRRFPKSLYWSEFVDSFALAVAQTGYGEGDQFKELLESLERLSTPVQREVLLRLSQASLTHGRLELAAALADSAAYLSIAASPEMGRAKLYRAAAHVASGEAEQYAQVLEKLDPQVFSPKDRHLLANALSLLGQIRAEPSFTDAEAKLIAFAKGPAPPSAEMDAAMASARAALEKSTALVKPDTAETMQ